MMKNVVLAITFAAACAWQLTASGQAPRQRQPAARQDTLPRTPDGHPDLQGTYDLATMTPLERPAALGTQLTMSDEQARRLEQAAAARRERAALPDSGDRQAPPIGGDGSTGAAGNVGGYNSFWVDNGTSFVTVNGQKRTSIVVEPPNGRVPPPTAEARQRQAARALRTSDEQERRCRRLRRPGTATARRALPSRIRVDIRAARAAGPV
jgi:hypothetical protein